MDVRIIGLISPCTTTRQTALGYVSFTLTFTPPSPYFDLPSPHASKRAYGRILMLTLAYTDQRSAHKQKSAILRDGNEIAFGSPMQQQTPLDDYRFIYRHLAPVELTGVHTFYNMAHELGRGTFATVMKAMSMNGRPSRSSTHRSSASNNNNNENNGGENNNNNRKDRPTSRASRERSASWRNSTTQISVASARHSFLTWEVTISVSFFFLFQFILGCVARRALTRPCFQTSCWNI